ncbi:restriction endonuclease subunit S [Vibrio cholerae]|uniref:restriction endonuclease subunit S n=1 Tax=Vibrio cholerae TaxID=666 RepID=UPI0010FE4C66|nr:restriction endonuclease subunit S [Vibrio cholerae]ELY5264650.1 restriction endonuclease subunit S [Vibrio cholerae]MDV2314679.1 restriction endonuclease subunit S [Vibrio cholerae]TLE10622.1 restriction endonuclease subunit S [Vibrio cholerae]
MVPEGWKVKQLADVCSKQISYGIVQTGEHQPNGIPCLRVVDLTKDEMHPEKMIRTSVEIHESYRKTILEKDEIVMALRGEVGLVRQINTKLVGANITRGLARISAKPQLVAPEFLLWELRSPKFRADLMRRVGGSALQEISLSELRKVQTLIPPLPEQKKIAKILSTWDKAITTTEQLLANSQQQKKALMQQLLTGRKRLLDKNGVRFSGEWIHGRLGDLCTFKGGSAFKEEYQGQTAGELPFIKVSDMNLPGNERSIEYSNNWVSVETAKLMKAKPFPESSIVFAKVGAALLLNRRRILSRPTIIDNNMMAAIPSNVADTEFLYQLLMAIDFARFVQEGAVPSINQGDLSSFKLSYPDVEEQQKIAAALSTTDQEIAVLQQKLEALKQEKKALMQQLLTGKRRVKIDNKEVV